MYLVLALYLVVLANSDRDFENTSEIPLNPTLDNDCDAWWLNCRRILLIAIENLWFHRTGQIVRSGDPENCSLFRKAGWLFFRQ